MVRERSPMYLGPFAICRKIRFGYVLRLIQEYLYTFIFIS